MLNMRIQQNYRIDMETVEKLMDIKAKTGTSVNEMVNEALKVYTDFKEKSSGDNPETVSDKSSGDDPEKAPRCCTVEDDNCDVCGKEPEAKKEGTSTFAERAAFALGDDMDE
jgi:hypothetical protein